MSRRQGQASVHLRSLSVTLTVPWCIRSISVDRVRQSHLDQAGHTDPTRVNMYWYLVRKSYIIQILPEQRCVWEPSCTDSLQVTITKILSAELTDPAERTCAKDQDPMDHTRETCMCERSRSSRFHVDKHVLDHADLIHHFSRNDLDHADPIDPPPQNDISRGSYNNNR